MTCMPTEDPCQQEMEADGAVVLFDGVPWPLLLLSGWLSGVMQAMSTLMAPASVAWPRALALLPHAG